MIPAVLGAHGIEVVHALAGVGANYQDHYIVRQTWKVKQPITLNEQTRGFFIAKEVLKYAFTRKGIMTFPGGILSGYVRTRPEVAGPDVQYTIVHGQLQGRQKAGL